MKGFIFSTIALGLTGSLFTSNTTHLTIHATKPQLFIRHPRDETALAYGLPLDLFAALEQIESGGRQNVTRFEPHLAKRVKPGQGWDSRALATSFGPMQVLGLNYRAKGLSPSAVNDLKTNYELSAAYLSNCKAKHRTWKKAALCYNGFGNPKYPINLARAFVRISKKS